MADENRGAGAGVMAHITIRDGRRPGARRRGGGALGLGAVARAAARAKAGPLTSHGLPFPPLATRGASFTDT